MKTPPPGIQESADDFLLELKAMRDAYQAMRQIHPDNREAAANWILSRLTGQEQARVTLAPPNFDNVKKAEPETVVGVSTAGSVAFKGDPGMSAITGEILKASTADAKKPATGAPDFSEMSTLRQLVQEAVRLRFGGIEPTAEGMADFVRSLRDGENGPRKGFLCVIPDDSLNERIASILEG
jgi:hypothetical protein